MKNKKEKKKFIEEFKEESDKLVEGVDDFLKCFN